MEPCEALGRRGATAAESPCSSDFNRLDRSGTIEGMAGFEDVPDRPARSCADRGGCAPPAARWCRRRRRAAEVRPIVEAVAERRAAAALEFGESFDGIRPGAVRVPAAALARALAELDPAVRAALEVAIERTRTVHADQRRTDTVTGWARGHRHRALGARRTGRPLRSRRQCRLPVQRGDERRSGPDRRGQSLVIASPPQADFGGLATRRSWPPQRRCSVSTGVGRRRARRRWRC